MNLYIQMISELFLDRDEFLRLYSPMNKTIKFFEFFCILSGSLSLSIASLFSASSVGAGYIGLILLLTLGHYFFLSFISNLLSYSVEIKSKDLLKTGDLPTLIASARSLNIIYIFACPFAIIFAFIGIPSISTMLLVIAINVSIYIWIFSKYANDIYGIGSFRVFRLALTSYFFVFYIPIIIIFYFVLNMTVMI